MFPVSIPVWDKKNQRGNLLVLQMLRIGPLKVLAVVFIVFQACGGDNRKKDPAAILHRPPFAGITDSIEQSPNDPALYLRRAQLLSQNNYLAQATPDYKKAWELTKDESVELEYISNLLLTDQANVGVALLREGTVKHADNTEFNRRLGELYLQRNQPDSAIRQFDLIIAKDSSNFEAWYDKGNLLAALKDTNGAIACLERSFALMPIKYSGLVLAQIYAAKKNPRALSICDRLLSQDSAGVETDPLYVKGIYYSEINNYDLAIKEFDSCILRDWKMTDAYIEKGIIYFELKKTDSALHIFNLAATVSNTDPDAYFWMGRCYEAKGDNQEAANNYDRAYALDKTFIEAREGLERVTK